MSTRSPCQALGLEICRYSYAGFLVLRGVGCHGAGSRGLRHSSGSLPPSGDVGAVVGAPVFRGFVALG
jgi:hypothetical protein